MDELAKAEIAERSEHADSDRQQNQFEILELIGAQRQPSRIDSLSTAASGAAPSDQRPIFRSGAQIFRNRCTTCRNSSSLS